MAQKHNNTAISPHFFAPNERERKRMLEMSPNYAKSLFGGKFLFSFYFLLSFGNDVTF